MQQDKPTQFRSSIFRDFGPAEMPRKSAAESGFGRGYTVGFFIFFGLAVASFLTLFLAKSDLGRAHGIGYVLLAFGAFFTFGIVYTIVTNKSIPWWVNRFGRVTTGEWNRRTSAVRFWGFCVITLVLFTLLMGAGIWILMHTEDVASFLRQHPPRSH